MSPITLFWGKFPDIVKSACAKDLTDIMLASALQCKGKTSVSDHSPFHFIMDCYNYIFVSPGLRVDTMYGGASEFRLVSLWAPLNLTPVSLLFTCAGQQRHLEIR